MIGDWVSTTCRPDQIFLAWFDFALIWLIAMVVSIFFVISVKDLITYLRDER